MQHIFHDPNGLNKYFGEEKKGNKKAFYSCQYCT